MAVFDISEAYVFIIILISLLGYFQDILARGLDVVVQLPPAKSLCLKLLNYAAVLGRIERDCRRVELLVGKRIINPSLNMIFLGEGGAKGCRKSNQE